MFAHALVRARRGSRGGGLLGCREGVDVSPTDPEFTTIADIYPLRITARGADKADKTVRATVVRRGALNAEDAAIILFQRHSASRFELRPNQKANWVQEGGKNENRAKKGGKEDRGDDEPATGDHDRGGDEDKYKNPIPSHTYTVGKLAQYTLSGPAAYAEHIVSVMSTYEIPLICREDIISILFHIKRLLLIFSAVIVFLPRLEALGRSRGDVRKALLLFAAAGGIDSEGAPRVTVIVPVSRRLCHRVGIFQDEEKAAEEEAGQEAGNDGGRGGGEGGAAEENKALRRRVLCGEPPSGDELYAEGDSSEAEGGKGVAQDREDDGDEDEDEDKGVRASDKRGRKKKMVVVASDSSDDAGGKGTDEQRQRWTPGADRAGAPGAGGGGKNGDHRDCSDDGGDGSEDGSGRDFVEIREPPPRRTGVGGAAGGIEGGRGGGGGREGGGDGVGGGGGGSSIGNGGGTKRAREVDGGMEGNSGGGRVGTGTWEGYPSQKMALSLGSCRGDGAGKEDGGGCYSGNAAAEGSGKRPARPVLVPLGEDIQALLDIAVSVSGGHSSYMHSFARSHAVITRVSLGTKHSAGDDGLAIGEELHESVVALFEPFVEQGPTAQLTSVARISGAWSKNGGGRGISSLDLQGDMMKAVLHGGTKKVG
jgi:hypothetical protein